MPSRGGVDVRDMERKSERDLTHTFCDVVGLLVWLDLIRREPTWAEKVLKSSRDIKYQVAKGTNRT